MGSFVDFGALKEKITIEQVLIMLDLKVKKCGNGQFRGCCPIHQGSNDRQFVATPGKNLWICFGGCGGGDIVALVAKVRGVKANEAAALIDRHFGNQLSGNQSVTENGSVTRGGNRSVPQKPQEPRRREFDAAAYAARLQPEHAALEPLQLDVEILQKWKAGFCPSGINAGRLALPVAERNGTVIAYISRAIDEPTLKFPTGFDPTAYIFNAHQTAEGEIRLVRDVLDVLRAEAMGETAICFLTELIEPSQHEMLAALQDERKFKVFY